MKVLLITHSIGDPEVVSAPGISDQITEMGKMGVEFEIWMVRAGCKRSYVVTALRILGLNFHPRRYDLIHATYSLNGFIALLQWKYPVIVSLLGSDLVNRDSSDLTGERDSLIGRLVAHLAKRVIVQTDEMAKAVPGDIGKVAVIPYGINTTIFHPIPVAEARRELQLSANKRIILFPYDPARTEKQFHLLEKAVEKLKPEMFVQLIAVFGKPREKIAFFMNASDVMVLVSSHEGSPVAVREALACGLPVVSVPVGDVVDLIADVDGCHICSYDPADIAEKVKLVFGNNRRIKPPEKATARDTKWSAARIMEVYNGAIHQ